MEKQQQAASHACVRRDATFGFVKKTHLDRKLPAHINNLVGGNPQAIGYGGHSGATAWRTWEVAGALHEGVFTRDVFFHADKIGQFVG